MARSVNDAIRSAYAGIPNAVSTVETSDLVIVSFEQTAACDRNAVSYTKCRKQFGQSWSQSSKESTEGGEIVVGHFDEVQLVIFLLGN